MTRRIFLVLVLLNAAAPALAQTTADPVCNGSGTDVLTTGKAFLVKWTEQQQITQNGTTVAHRYDGFYVQVDTQPEVAVPLSAEIGVCPAGTARPSDKIYSYQSSGVQKGNHNVSVVAWNWAVLKNPDGTPQLNPDGTPKYSTTQKERSTPVLVPFVANDAMVPTYLDPPLPPNFVSVRKQ